MSPTHSFESGSAPKKPETLSLAAEKAELLSKLQQLREERKRLEREITEEEEAAKEHAKLAEQPVQETVETEEIEPLEESKSYQETEHTYIDFTDVPGDPKGAAAEAKPRGSAGKTLKKMGKGALIVGGLALGALGTEKALHHKGMQEKKEHVRTLEEEAGYIYEHMDKKLFPKLETEGKDAYIKILEKHLESKEAVPNWAIVSKKNAYMYILDGQTGKELHSEPLLVAKRVGDTTNDSEIVYDPKAYAFLPPMYTTSGKHGLEDYEGTTEYTIHIYTNPDAGIEVHGFVPHNLQFQKDLIHSADPKKRRVTHGCMRAEYIETVAGLLTEGSEFASLPDEGGEGEATMTILDMESKTFEKTDTATYYARPDGKLLRAVMRKAQAEKPQKAIDK